MKVLGEFKTKNVFQRVMLVLVVMVMFLTLVGCSAKDASGSSNSNGEQKKIELRLAHFFPGTHPVETELVQKWAAAIEEATEGRITIVSYPGQTLLQADAIYEGVTTGIADVGLSCFSYTRGRFSVLEVFELPGVRYDNSKVASKVAWEGIRELNPPEVQDTKLLMVFATGPGDLFTKVPVRSLEDMRGLEIRATGLSAVTIEALGGIPVAMPQSDAYEALSKGVVKGNLSPVEVLGGWRHAEVTDYLTLTPFLYNTLFFITMNLDTWNSLTPDTQLAIETVSQAYFEEMAMGLWDMQNETALKWAVEETGQEIITLSEEEAARWVNLVQPIKDDYIKRIDGQGYNGREIMDLVEGLADRYNQEYGK
ncbi:TRAP transporter substrate-binding protein [Desulfitibacter alkalitolerans]|uniref:TRAP transporter substrate-binding protein n=1 Tax=Desulfitibacter alkalitolerans TaxID=264641 RepID=UPI00047FA358|nr:TRAP transporter substrate-binding protein [Desulfitibacter alkalitolerans]